VIDEMSGDLVAPADGQAQSPQNEPLFRVRLWTRVGPDCKHKISAAVDFGSLASPGFFYD